MSNVQASMSNSAPQASRSRAAHARRAAAVIVTLLSGIWVTVLLVQAWPELAPHLHEVRVSLLAFGLLLSVASAYLTFEAFATVVNAIGIAAMPKHHLAHLHFTGQLLKHLPGRIWGVGYQWAAGNSAGTLGDWLLANLGHMLLATFFALWTAWLALAAAQGPGWAGLAVIGGLAVYVLGWQLVSSVALQRLAARLPGRASGLGRSLQVFAKAPVSARARIFLLFCGSWLLFYAAWIAFGLAYPPLGPSGGARICAYYMLAWFAGYISLLTPSGLGVRELAFAWLAHGFSSDVVALMAIVGRVSLLAVDILLGLLFAPFSPRRKKS
jgi:hypothetical protein